jgi:hypothetical protein
MMTTKTTAAMTSVVSGFGPLQVAIAVLVATTALIHLYLGASLTLTLMGPNPEDAGMAEPMAAILAFLFLCNFGGYVVLIAALYLPALRRFQNVTRAVLIGYTAMTFIAYYAIHLGHTQIPLGLAATAIEAAIVALLIIDGRRARA